MLFLVKLFSEAGIVFFRAPRLLRVQKNDKQPFVPVLKKENAKEGKCINLYVICQVPYQNLFYKMFLCFIVSVDDWACKYLVTYIYKRYFKSKLLPSHYFKALWIWILPGTGSGNRGRCLSDLGAKFSMKICRNCAPKLPRLALPNYVGITALLRTLDFPHPWAT